MIIADYVSPEDQMRRIHDLEMENEKLNAAKQVLYAKAKARGRKIERLEEELRLERARADDMEARVFSRPTEE